MGKYEPLTRYLSAKGDDRWDARFADIERILGFELPESARAYPAWWANETRGGHSQKKGWQDAGWETVNVDLSGKKLSFVRRKLDRSEADKELAGAWQKRSDLFEQARAFTGIEDRAALIDAGLLALIQREAGRRLIEMGGTMPGFEAAPRERPSA